MQDLALVEPVTITNNGRDRLVMMSAEEYRRLKRRDRRVMTLDDFTDEDIAALEKVRAPAEAAAFNHQGHRIKIGELGRMANPAFGENLSFCGTSSHLFTMCTVTLVITNKYNLHVQ